MRVNVCRPTLTILLAAAVAATAAAQAPPAGTTRAQPKTKAKATAPKAASTPKPAQAPKAAQAQAPAATAGIPKADEVLATVNGEPIDRGDVVGMLRGYVIPPGQEEEAYRRAIDQFVTMRLLSQFIREQGVEPDPKGVDAQIAEFEKNMKENGTDLASELARNDVSLDEFRERIERQLQWKTYVLSQATDAVLKDYAEKNKDLFSDTQVKASHILVSVPPEATPEQSEQARQKAAAIKKEIDGGKISFADAANKYSDDPGNKQTPNGGDLGYFGRRDMVEPFATQAFRMQPGTISDPILTEYGYHIIQVNDRREGQPFDLERDKPNIINHYASDLIEKVVEEKRKSAKIEIKPMPADLFPREAPAASDADVAPPAATKPAATKPAATKP